MLGGESDRPDSFDAVYYSYAVPRSSLSLTPLGLIFDRIYFPAVYMPPAGFDEKALQQRIERLTREAPRDPDTTQLVKCLDFAIQNKHLSDLCVFSGKPGGIDTLEEGTQEVVDQLETMVFGPRPEGNIPIRTGPWVTAVSGDDSVTFQVSAPDTITYPANAMVFAARNGLPLINDMGSLPVPGIVADPKANAKILATILTMESVKLVLPTLKPLQPVALHDLRMELAPYLKPFRLSMLRLAKELNAAIVAGAPLADVQKQAKFLVDTDVYPQLAELEAVVQNPAKHWYNRAVDAAKAVPELAVNLTAMPASLAIAKFLAKIAIVLSQARDEQIVREDQVAKTGLHYLLKLKDAAAR